FPPAGMYEYLASGMASATVMKTFSAQLSPAPRLSAMLLGISSFCTDVDGARRIRLAKTTTAADFIAASSLTGISELHLHFPHRTPLLIWRQQFTATTNCHEEGGISTDFGRNELRRVECAAASRIGRRPSSVMRRT